MRHALVFAAASSLSLSALLGAVPAPLAAQARPIEPGDSAWRFRGEAGVATHEGGDVVRLRSGSAHLPGIRFSDGTIELEMLPTDRRAFLGVVFREGEDGDAEDVYVRLHKSGLVDAVQYTPDYRGRGQWQLHHGPDATAAARYRAGEWQPIRVEVRGARAAVFVGEGAAEPVLVVDRLRTGRTEGTVGFWSNFPGAEGDDPPTALLRNVVIRHGETRYEFEPPAVPDPEPGLIREWGLSETFVREGDAVRELPSGIPQGEWRTVATEALGLLPIERHVERPAEEGVPAVLAGLRIRAASERIVRLDLGFSDDATVFLDGRPIYSGEHSFSPNFPRRQGLITLDQASVYLPLGPGEHDVVVAVSEEYGGWGVMGRIVDRDGIEVEPLRDVLPREVLRECVVEGELTLLGDRAARLETPRFFREIEADDGRRVFSQVLLKP